MTDIDLEAVRRQLTAPGAPFELVEVELQGGRAPAYRNAFRTLPELIAAGRAHAGREFMTYGEDRWSFERFYAAVDALAGRLHHELGLRPGHSTCEDTSADPASLLDQREGFPWSN